MLPVSTYSFQIQANGAFPLQVNGRYFRINAASGSLKVIGDTFGPMGSVAVGQGLRLPKESPVFQRLTLVDTSGALNNVTIIVADADFVDNTVLGSVSVIDGGKSRTLSGASFSMVVYANGVAAKLPCVQLLNHGSNNKRMVVEQVLASSTANFAVALLLGAGALNTIQVASAPSKLSGGTSEVYARGYTDNLAAAPAGSTQFGQIAGAANTTSVYRFSEPIVLPPGYTLTAYNSLGVGADVTVTFEFYEEPNT